MICTFLICYREAYRRQGNIGGTFANDDSDDSDDSSSSSSESDGDDDDSGGGPNNGAYDPGKDPFYFRDDPMTILNNVGLETASTFCFRLLSDLKSHLENVHDVDPSQMARGNDLFKRFK